MLPTPLAKCLTIRTDHRQLASVSPHPRLVQLGRASLIAEDDVLAPTLRDDDHSTVPTVVCPCSGLLDETMFDQPCLVEKHIAD